MIKQGCVGPVYLGNLSPETEAEALEV